MHNINKMAFTGEVPWHGLGTQLPHNATYEEIAELAGFYKAEERRLFIEGTDRTAPDRKALVRGDDGRYLSIVGDGYKVIDFSEVARTMVEAAGMYGGFFTTAGTLGPTGIRGWLLGELPGEIVVRGDPSPIKKFFLGSAGHDGVTPIVLSNCATRVVCQNTLGTALNERGGARFKILHTPNAALRLERAAAAMKRLLTSYDRFGAVANQLAVTRLSTRQVETSVATMLPVPDDDKRHTRILRDRETILELFETGIGIENEIRGTSWALFQAATEFADHHRTVRVTDDTDPKHARLESIWFGRGAQLKELALNTIVAQSNLQLAA